MYKIVHIIRTTNNQFPLSLPEAGRMPRNRARDHAVSQTDDIEFFDCVCKAYSLRKRELKKFIFPYQETRKPAVGHHA